jgi:hypothetical protein
MCNPANANRTYELPEYRFAEVSGKFSIGKNFTSYTLVSISQSPSNSIDSRDRKVNSQHDHITTGKMDVLALLRQHEPILKKTILRWKDWHIRFIRTG